MIEANAAVKLPVWIYERLAREAVEECRDTAGLEPGGTCCKFSAGDYFEACGRELFIEVGGYMELETEDRSFAHAFGVEEDCRTRPSGLLLIDRLTVADGNTDEPLAGCFDERLFAQKVNALC